MILAALAALLLAGRPELAGPAAAVLAAVAPTACLLQSEPRFRDDPPGFTRVRWSRQLVAVSLGLWGAALCWPASLPTSLLRSLGWCTLASAALALTEWLGWRWERSLRRRGRPTETAHLMVDLSRVVLCLALTFATGWAQGIQKLEITSAFFSLALGFALKPTLGNLVSGLLLRVSHDFALGDYLKIGDLDGEVSRIDWRSITLQDDDTGAEMVIVHSVLADSLLLNRSRPTRGHASYIELALSRELPPAHVRSALLELLRGLPDHVVERTPEPEVYLLDLNGAGCTYRIRWWMAESSQRPELEAEVRQRLSYGLSRLGWRWTSPARRLERGVVPDFSTSPMT